MENLHGLTGGFTEVFGKMENNMDEVFIEIH